MDRAGRWVEFCRTFLGSVSDYCVRHAKCPMVIVKLPKDWDSAAGWLCPGLMARGLKKTRTDGSNGATWKWDIILIFLILLLWGHVVNSNPDTKFQSLHHLLSTNQLFTKIVFNKIKKNILQIPKSYFAKQVLIF